MTTMELYLDCEELKVEVDAEESIARIMGQAAPYGIAGYPRRRDGGNPGPIALAFESLEFDDGTVFCEGHVPTPGNTLSSMLAEGPKGVLQFTSNPVGCDFLATVDTDAPLSGQIHSNLKNGVIKGGVSLGFGIIESQKGRVRDIYGKVVEATIVTKAKVDHLAFLGNTSPAFLDKANAIAAEHAEEGDIVVIAVKDSDGEVRYEEQVDIDAETVTRRISTEGERTTYYDDDGRYRGSDAVETYKSSTRVEDGGSPPGDTIAEKIETVKFADSDAVEAALAAHKRMMNTHRK